MKTFFCILVVAALANMAVCITVTKDTLTCYACPEATASNQKPFGMCEEGKMGKEINCHDRAQACEKKIVGDDIYRGCTNAAITEDNCKEVEETGAKGAKVKATKCLCAGKLCNGSTMQRISLGCAFVSFLVLSVGMKMM